MPRPPILPTIDWKSVFESGKSFADWLAGAELPEKREAMQELLKGMKLAPIAAAAIKGLARPVHVVAIAEDWCGDVVRQVPALQKLAEAGSNLRVRFIARAQHPDVFARFLTNGGEAIPKFIFLSDKFVECGNWGPMPAACRELIARGKAAGDVAPWRAKAKLLFDADPDRIETVRELMALIDIAATTND